MIKIKDDFLLFFSHLKNLNIKKTKLIIIFFTIIASNCIGLINPIFFGRILDAVINKSLPAIKYNILLMFLFFVISIILNYVNTIMMIKVTTNLETNMKEKIFSSTLQIPYHYFKEIDKGNLINNIEYDSTVFSNLLLNNISLIINIIDVIVASFFMIFINPYLTIIFFITFPITTILHIISGKKIKLKEIQYRNHHDLYTSFLNETIYGWKFLKLFNAENKREDMFKKIIKNLYSIKIKKSIIQLWTGILINVVSYIAYTINILLGIYLIFQGKFSLGMLTAFNTYSDRFKNSSLSLAQVNSIIQEISVSLSRINDILDYSKQNLSKNNIFIKLNKDIEEIKINQLSYSISDNNEIFKNTDIIFKKNNIYIIKGESGSGKTTLLNILCKFIDTYSGEILIDDIPLEKIDTQFLRNKVSYITQDNFLYSLSIYENVSLYRDIHHEKIIDICKKLNIHKTIMSLPNQYDTIINENGTDLSGGEKQRLCIARAIIGNPDVYLFDEITSAIDKKNIIEVLSIIEDISKNAIVILTSHENLDFSIPIIEYYLENKKFSYK